MKKYIFLCDENTCDEMLPDVSSSVHEIGWLSSYIAEAGKMQRAQRLRTARLLKKALSFLANCGVCAEDLKLKKQEGGKPYFEASQLKISISHSDDISVLAFAMDTEIGIDIEAQIPENRSVRLDERYLSKISFYDDHRSKKNTQSEVLIGENGNACEDLRDEGSAACKDLTGEKSTGYESLGSKNSTTYKDLKVKESTVCERFDDEKNSTYEDLARQKGAGCKAFESEKSTACKDCIGGKAVEDNANVCEEKMAVFALKDDTLAPIALCSSDGSVTEKWTQLEAVLKCDGGGFSAFSSADELAKKMKIYSFVYVSNSKKYYISLASRDDV